MSLRGRPGLPTRQGHSAQEAGIQLQHQQETCSAGSWRSQHWRRNVLSFQKVRQESGRIS